MALHVTVDGSFRPITIAIDDLTTARHLLHLVGCYPNLCLTFPNELPTFAKSLYEQLLAAGVGP